MNWDPIHSAGCVGGLVAGFRYILETAHQQLRFTPFRRALWQSSLFQVACGNSPLVSACC